MKSSYKSIIVILSFICFFCHAEPSLDFVRQHAKPLGPSFSILPNALPLLEKYKVITIGEMHGTVEAPLFTAGLVKALALTRKSVLLALEIDESNQGHIDEFLRSGDYEKLKMSPFFKRAFQDGRSSKAMADLLDSIRSLKNVRVYCFDPAESSNSAQERDSKMALSLRAAFGSLVPSIMVILAGNIHSSLAQGTPWDPSYKPMGYELYSQPGSGLKKSDILAIGQRYMKGSAWICLTNAPCGETPLAAPESNYSRAGIENYLLKEDQIYDGYNATVFFNTIHASKPLNEDHCSIPSEQLQLLLSMTYEAFDQTMGKGWREYSDDGRYLCAAKILDAYNLAHLSDLTPGQKRVIAFHAGQNYGFEHLYPTAIERFEQSFNPKEEPRPELSWNAYVGATIAFMKGDKKQLQSNRDEIAHGVSSPGNAMNLKVVDCFLRYFNRSYKDAYMSQD